MSRLAHEKGEAARNRYAVGQRGQALAETAIVVSLLLLLVLGVVEFGRAFMIANMIVHAARDGARMAAVTPVTQRDSNGIINSTAQTSIKNHVRSAISSVLGTTAANALTINVSQASGPPPIVTVQVTGSVPFIVKWAGFNSFSINRSVTFRDEGRTS